MSLLTHALWGSCGSPLVAHLSSLAWACQPQRAQSSSFTSPTPNPHPTHTPHGRHDGKSPATPLAAVTPSIRPQRWRRPRPPARPLWPRRGRRTPRWSATLWGRRPAATPAPHGPLGPMCRHRVGCAGPRPRLAANARSPHSRAQCWTTTSSPLGWQQTCATSTAHHHPLRQLELAWHCVVALGVGSVVGGVVGGGVEGDMRGVDVGRPKRTWHHLLCPSPLSRGSLPLQGPAPTRLGTWATVGTCRSGAPVRVGVSGRSQRSAELGAKRASQRWPCGRRADPSQVRS